MNDSTHRVFHHIAPVWSYVVLGVGIQPPGKLFDGRGHSATKLRGRIKQECKLVMQHLFHSVI